MSADNRAWLGDVCVNRASDPAWERPALDVTHTAEPGDERVWNLRDRTGEWLPRNMQPLRSTSTLPTVPLRPRTAVLVDLVSAWAWPFVEVLSALVWLRVLLYGGPYQYVLACTAILVLTDYARRADRRNRSLAASLSAAAATIRTLQDSLWKARAQARGITRR